MAGNPLIQIRGSSCVIFEEPVFRARKSWARRLHMASIQKSAYSGAVTVGLRKRLAKAICLLVQASPPSWKINPATGRLFHHRVSFITLTVAMSRNITAKEGYATLLNHFLDWLTKTKGVTAYVWKAELQQRGQLHYHLTIPAVIHMKEIRRKWNELQRRAGYLEDWVKKHGHYHPPSTQIRDTHSVRDMERYLIKELCKSIDARKLYLTRVVDSLIKAGELPADKRQTYVVENLGQELATEGRIWGCSLNLSKARYWNTYLRTEHEAMIEQWEREGLIKAKRDTYFAVLNFEGIDPALLLNDQEKRIFESHVAAILAPIDG